MARVVCFVLAVVAGACAAFLLVLQPTVHYEGKSGSCPGIIVTSEGGNGVYSDAERGYKQACDDKQHDWSVLAGLAALVSIAAGSGVRFSRPDPESRDARSHGRRDPAAG